jgi:hypothetical protein
VGDNKMRRVEIIGTSMSGFDVGIGVDIASLELKVEGSSIDALTHGVETHYKAYSDTTVPTVDFGGGPLGSAGKNIFSSKPAFAYDHHTGVYLVYACYNQWNVSTSQVDPLRIWDKLDEPNLGRVFWNCLASPPPTSEIGNGSGDSSLVAIPTQNTNCRKGNSSTDFDVVDTLLSNTAYVPVGRGFDNRWLLFQAPSTGAPCWAFIDLFNLVDGVDIVLIEEIPETILPFVPYPFVPTETPTREPVERDTDVPTPCQSRVC